MATRERSRPTQVQRIATPQSEIVARPSPPVIDTAVETTVMANVDGMATPDRGISMFMEIRWPGDTIGGV